MGLSTFVSLFSGAADGLSITNALLRLVNKYIKYVSSKQTEAELRIHFCFMLKATGIRIHKNKTLANMYMQQLKKINTVLQGLHEDIQYDYLKQTTELSLK